MLFIVKPSHISSIDQGLKTRQTIQDTSFGTIDLVVRLNPVSLLAVLLEMN